MTKTMNIAALAFAAGIITLPFSAAAQTAPKTIDPAIVDAYDCACTDDVADRALITWLIMH